MIDTKKILDAATQRYQDIIVAVNKGDLEEIKGLCLSSIFGEESEFCGILANDKDNQVTDMKVLCRDKCIEYEWLKPFLEGFKKYLETDGHESLLYWADYKDIMNKVYSYLLNMCSDWFTEEPTCVLAESSLQMYNLLKQIDYAVIWNKFLSLITEYMETTPCTVAATTSKDVAKYIVNVLLEDL